MIKTLTVAPYKSIWLNVAVGSYTLTAKATDNTGASTTSAAVHITVTAGGGNQPPTVSITQPAQGATFTAPASIAISANAADSDGSVSRVEFFANGSSLGVDTTAPYSITWSGVAAGSYSLTARATDNLGATTTSSAVGITVNPGGGNQPPVANAGGPYSGTVSTAIQFNGSGSYDPDGTITSYNWSYGDGGNGTVATPTHVYSTAGTYTVTLTVTDNQGAQASASTSATISAGGGGTPVPGDGLANVSYDQTTNRINTAGWEYDAAGNQTRVQRVDLSWQRYVYDAAGRLVKVQNDSNVTQLVNTYGASNHRLIEQVGNESSNQRIYYAWAGDSVIAEYSESATNPLWSKSYVYLGARLLATIASNGGSERVEYQHPDRLGTRVVTNNQDTSSFEQVSLPFGTALDAESTGSTKRRFTSYDRSTMTGLDYAVNRHYDPWQGRFTQVDPIGMASVSLENPQSLNLYAYCTNDPINHTDPSGLGFWSFLGKVFSFFAKIAKWVAIVVAVAVIVAAILQVGFDIQLLPILGDILSKLGILKLGGVGASFAAGAGGAAVGVGATAYVIGGLAAAGAVNVNDRLRP